MGPISRFSSEAKCDDSSEHFIHRYAHRRVCNLQLSMNDPVAIRAEALEILQSRPMCILHVFYEGLAMVDLNASLAGSFAVLCDRIQPAKFAE